VKDPEWLCGCSFPVLPSSGTAIFSSKKNRHSFFQTGCSLPTLCARYPGSSGWRSLLLQRRLPYVLSSMACFFLHGQCLRTFLVFPVFVRPPRPFSSCFTFLLSSHIILAAVKFPKPQHQWVPFRTHCLLFSFSTAKMPWAGRHTRSGWNVPEYSLLFSMDYLIDTVTGFGPDFLLPLPLPAPLQVGSINIQVLARNGCTEGIDRPPPRIQG